MRRDESCYTTNLIDETLEILHDYEKSEKDIKYVKAGDQFCTWDQMKEDYDDLWYYDGFGSEEVNPELMILGDDWYLTRWEYDGSEGWTFHQFPKIPDQIEFKKFEVVAEKDWRYEKLKKDRNL